jgi:hypothetical protein
MFSTMNRSNNSDINGPYIINIKETPKVSSGQLIDLPDKTDSFERRTTMMPKSSFTIKKNMLEVKVDKVRKLSKSNGKSKKMTLNLPEEPKKRKRSSINPPRYELACDI